MTTEPARTPNPNGGATPLRRASHAVGSLLAGMRIRKKLIILHTSFSVVMAGILALALRPAVREVVQRAELHEATLVAEVAAVRGDTGALSPATRRGVNVAVGLSGESGLSPADESRVMEATRDASLRADDPDSPAARPEPGVRSIALDPPSEDPDQPRRVAAYDPASRRFAVASVRLDGARDAVVRLYILLTIALLAVYALVAAALEIFVLPEHVYGPIRRLLAADQAVQEGKREEELIDESAMPSDELGEIMRSRNKAITALHQHESALADALSRLEEVAADLQRKNHLLENAKRNLADADRLASLGVMSAGLAHEMNTPLTVLKGLTEKLAMDVHSRPDAPPDQSHPPADPATDRPSPPPAGLSRSEADLMLRVVKRLEKLSESLLDFARVRQAQMSSVDLGLLVDEAWTLVRLDRLARDVHFVNRVPIGMVAECDADRILQVVVNLVRNAVDAMETQSRERAIEVASTIVERDDARWISLTITDTGPGIDPDVLPNLFEPFVSTRLDSRGTGLGLAVSEGIVSEHGGLLMARNRTDRAGAIFEILLPIAS